MYEKELDEYRQKQKESLPATDILELGMMEEIFGNYALTSIEDFAPEYSMKNDPAYKYFNKNQLQQSLIKIITISINFPYY